MQALVKLQKDAKVGQIGVSNVNLTELKEYCRYGKIDFIQNRFSLINRSIDSLLEKYLLEKKIGLIPYQVIDRGQLTINLSKLNKNDLRLGRPDWQKEKVESITNWAEKEIIPLAQDLKITPEQLMIAWALAQKYLGFVIVGATKLEQVIANLRANEIKLSGEILTKIGQSYLKLEKEIKQQWGVSVREFRGLNEKYY